MENAIEVKAQPTQIIIIIISIDVDDHFVGLMAKVSFISRIITIR